MRRYLRYGDYFPVILTFLFYVDPVWSESCGAPVNCIVSDWTEFEPCSVSCNTGNQTRTRTILQEAKCGGTCDLETTNTVKCNTQCCPQNCEYSHWTSWYIIGKSTDCELPGERPRYARDRLILQDAMCGGYCDYIKSEEKCGDLLCAKDCALGPWSMWSLCQAPCEQKGIRTRTKHVLQEAECGGKECGVREEEEQCMAGCCPINCELGPWSAWSPCDVTCGTANQTRSRFVQLPECKGIECTEEPKSEDTRSCENYINVDCTVGPWSSWSNCVLVNGFCGLGYENRTRGIAVPTECQGKDCPPLTDSRECFGPCCKQDCVVSEWTNWSSCSTTCGAGISQKTREVLVQAACNGTLCPDLLEQKDCNVTETIHCQLSEWTEWSNCSTDCGTGKQFRTRTLETPAYCGGSQCVSMDYEEEKDCESYEAKRDCQVGEWSQWGDCVRDCNKGLQIRSRTIVSNPVCGGQSCPSLNMSEWGPWLECIRDCSGGMQKRFRTVVQAEQCGGKSCSTLGIRTCHEECSQLCKNGVCSCKPEYQLMKNGYDCALIQCPPLPHFNYCPPNHIPLIDCLKPAIKCNQGYYFNANCTANCDNRGPEWSLKGSPNLITCLSTGMWSQPEIYCGLPNKAPYSLSIETSQIKENVPAKTCVIYMHVKDSSYDKATYEIMKDTKNLFYIEGNRLCLTRKTDFEEKPTKWNMTIRSTDLGGLYVEKVFEFEVLNENDPPTSVIISRDIIPENSAEGAKIGCLSGQDDDPGQNVTLALVNSDNELFATYKDESGVLCLMVAKASDPKCASEGGTYCQLNLEEKDHRIVTIMAMDDGSPQRVAYFDLKIRLSDKNDRPTGIVLDPPNVPEEIEPNKALVAIVTVDEDEEQIHSYQLLDDAGGLFKLKGQNLTASQKFDFENPEDQAKEFTIKINSTDNGDPPMWVVSNVTFRVGNVNEPPYDLTLTSSNAPIKFDNNKPQIKENANAVIVGTISVKDHDVGDVLSFSLAANDSDSRLSIMNQINSNVPGVNVVSMIILVALQSFNFETEPEVNVTIVVTDKEGLATNKTLQLQVLDVNDPPSDILIDGGNATLIKAPENQNNLIIGKLSAVDEDKKDVHAFFITDSAEGRFIVDNGILKTSHSANLDYETSKSYEITILVEDSGAPKQSYEKTFKIEVEDVNESPSEILLSDSQVKENSKEGTVVGTLSFSDPDNVVSNVQNLTFTLPEDGMGRFLIENNELKVKTSTLLCNNRPCELDFETEPQIEVNVKVTDNGTPPMSLNKTFTITLTDENDPPRDVRLAGNSVAENGPEITTVGKLSAVEEDPGQTVTFELLNGTDTFTLSVDSVVKTKTTFDREEQAQHYISVKSSDNGDPPATTTSVVIVNVLDINEEPKLQGPLIFSVKETTEKGAIIGILTSTDPDKGEDLILSTQSLGNIFTLTNTTCEGESSPGTSCSSTIVASVPLNHEDQDTYTLSVSVQDKNALVTTDNVVINIQDENDPPTDILVDGRPVSEIHVEEESQDVDISEFSALDEDTAQSHSFEILEGAEGKFEIVGNKLRVKAEEILNYEEKSSYNVKVQVTDDGSPQEKLEKTFTVLIEDINEAPSELKMDKQMVDENSPENTMIGKFSVVDPDNSGNNKQTFTFELLDNAGGRFKVHGSELQVATSNTDCLRVGGDKCSLNFEKSTNHIVRVLVSDSGLPSQSSAFNVSIQIRDVNDKPTSLQLSGFKVDKSAASGTEIGTMTVIDEDSSQTHTYTLVNDADGLFAMSPQGVLTKATGDDLDPQILYKIKVKVEDNGTPNKQEATAEFTLTVIGGNEAPTSLTFNSEGSQDKFEENKPSVFENTAPDTLIGSLVAMDTGADQQMTFSIQTNEGNNPLKISPDVDCVTENDVTKCTALVLMAESLDFERKDSYGLVVMVTDKDGMNLMELMELVVKNKNEAPMNIEYSGDVIAVHENMNEEPLGVFTVEDPDSDDSHTIKLTSENSEKFVIDSAGRLSTAAEANLDFETTPFLTVTLLATDKEGLQFEKRFNISVLDVNEKPEKIMLSSNKVPEMSDVGTEVGKISVEDPDKDQTFTIALLDDAGGRIKLEDGVLKVAAIGEGCNTSGGVSCLFDFESATSHDVVVKVTDSGKPQQSLTATLTIDVGDVNDPPTDLTLKVEEILETSEVGLTIATLQARDQDATQTLTYRISDGADMFSVTGNTITLTQPVDYESRSSYILNFTAEDTGSPPKAVTREFTLNVINVNEPPHSMSVESSSKGEDFDSNQPVIAENKPLDTLIGQILVFDPDTSDNLKFSTSNTEISIVNPVCLTFSKGLRCTADIRSSVVFDYEKQKELVLVLTASDQEGLTVSKEVTLTIIDANDPPSDLILTGELLVEENRQDITIGNLSAIDLDLKQTFTYTITSNTQDYYIAGNQLKVAAGADLNFEERSADTLSISVTDSGKPPLSYDKTFIISIQDVNEQPGNIQLSRKQVAEDSLPGFIVGMLTCDDPDNVNTQRQTLTYALTDNPQELFRIEGSNLVVNKADFDYEATQSYKIGVKVTDSGSSPLSFDTQLSIEVTDANDAPRDLQFSAKEITENSEVGSVVGILTAKDQDIHAGQTISYSLQSSKYFMVSEDKLLVGSNIDFEQTPSITFAVNATDDGTPAKMISKTFTVNVIDVNDPPSDIRFKPSAEVVSMAIPESLLIDDVVGTVEVTDVDASDRITFELTENTGQYFKLSSALPHCIAEMMKIGDTDHQGTKCTTTLLLAKVLNFEETRQQFSVAVRVSDTGGKQLTKMWTFAVANSNEPPRNLTLDGHLSVIPENMADFFIGTLITTDEDKGDKHIYQVITHWEVFSIQKGNMLVAKAALDYERKSEYNVTIRTKDDGTPSMFYDKTFRFTVSNVNEPPSNVSVTPNEVSNNAAVDVVVGHIVVTDPDNYHQDPPLQSHNCTVGGDGMGVFMADNKDMTLKVIGPIPADKTELSIRLSCTDNGSPPQELAKDLTIVVKETVLIPKKLILKNQKKIPENVDSFDVGEFHIVNLLSNEEIQGFYLYMIIGTGQPFTIDGGTLRSTEALDYETQPQVTLTVKGVGKDSQQRDVDITANFTLEVEDVNERPSGVGIYGGGKIKENSIQGTKIGNLHTVDEDMDQTYTYSIISVYPGLDPSAFKPEYMDMVSLNKSTLSIGKAAQYLDYETNDKFSVTVNTTDSGPIPLSFVDTVHLILEDVNDPPSDITLSKSQIAENNSPGDTVGRFTVTDQDKGQAHVCQVMNRAEVPFQIKDNFTLVAGNKVLDYEEQKKYTVNIECQDFGQDGTSLKFQKIFIVEVTNVNEPPSDISLNTKEIVENNLVGQVVGELSANDLDSEKITFSVAEDSGFKLQGDNTVVTTQIFDFEKTPEVELTLTATDAEGLSTSVDLVIKVLNVNEAPTDILLDNSDIMENSAPDTVIGTLHTEDEDRNQKFTYIVMKTGQTTGFVSIKGNQIVTGSKPLDYETIPQIKIVVNSTDNGSPPRTIQKEFMITVTDKEEPPLDIIFNNAIIKVNESTSPPKVLSAIQVDDPDAGQSHVCQNLNSSTPFSVITNEKKEMSLVLTGSLDFENTASYDITIRCSDGKFEKDKILTVNILDENEAPTSITLSSPAVKADAQPGYVIGQLNVLDPDKGQSHTLTVHGPNSDILKVNGKDLVLTSKIPESELSSSRPILNITILAADNGNPSLSMKEIFKLPITDIEIVASKLPSITIDNKEIPEDAAIGYEIGTLYNNNKTLGTNIIFELIENKNEVFSIKHNKYLVLAKNLTTVEGTSRKVTIRVKNVDTFDSETQTITIFIERITRCRKSDGESCHENARCVQINGSANHQCECESGYQGDGYSCEDVNECVSNPCNGHGQCVDEVNNYACICNEGYSGENCDVKEKELTNGCTAKPCKNGAVCEPKLSNHLAYSCSCKNGWHGSTCELSVDDCINADCNGGECIDKHLTYVCRCPKGQNSFRCQYNPDVCKDSSECSNEDNAMCIPKIKQKDHMCANKKDIVKMKLQKLSPDVDMAEKKAQVYDTILNLVKASRNKPRKRRKRSADSSDIQVYIISMKDRPDGYVDVEFVVLDSSEGVFTKDEVMNLLATSCKDIEADNMSETTVCPAVQKSTVLPQSQEPAEAGVPIPVIAGAAGGVILIVVIIIVIVCTRKKRKNSVDSQENGNSKDKNDSLGTDSRNSSGYSSLSKETGKALNENGSGTAAP